MLGSSQHQGEKNDGGGGVLSKAVEMEEPKHRFRLKIIKIICGAAHVFRLSQ